LSIKVWKISISPSSVENLLMIAGIARTLHSLTNPSTPINLTAAFWIAVSTAVPALTSSMAAYFNNLIKFRFL
jgi:hypothetical protein